MISNIIKSYNEKSITAGSISSGGHVEFISDTPMAITVKYTNAHAQLEYSIDLGANWIPISNARVTEQSDIIYIRGITNGLNQLFQGEGAANAWIFTGATNLIIIGKLNNLIQNPITKEAPTEIDIYCLANMFYGCGELVKAPDLPATTISRKCYTYMFYNCPKLATTPELPALVAPEYCYSGMFWKCSSLIDAPELPATTIEEFCYSYMFQDCINMEKTPSILPALTVVKCCYYYMFCNCAKITTPPVMPAVNLSTMCYLRMFYTCALLDTLPRLPAESMDISCYHSMFRNCRAIKVSLTQNAEYKYPFRFPDVGSGVISTSWNSYMFSGTVGTWTGNPNINTTYYTTKPLVKKER